MSTPYTVAAYRVERRTRPLSAEERSLVESRRAAWHAEVREQKGGTTRVTAGFTFVAFAAACVGLFFRMPAIAISSGAIGILVGAMTLVARRRVNAEIATARGPWDAPDSGFQIEETRIVARSVVGAVSAKEDFAFWLLFEIPHGDWFFMDPCVLSEEAWPPEEDLARGDLRLARLMPYGQYLSAHGRGDPLPRRGASGNTEDWAANVERGFVWSPPKSGDQAAEAEGSEHDDDSAELVGFVREASLPMWMRPD